MRIQPVVDNTIDGERDNDTFDDRSLESRLPAHSIPETKNQYVKIQP